jgi:hypothetical protein
MTLEMMKRHCEEMKSAILSTLGPTWLRGFLNCHPKVPVCFASNLDRQRAFASNPQPIREYFKKLCQLCQKSHVRDDNIYNMDEKGFVLGLSNRAKVVSWAHRPKCNLTRRGRRPCRAYSSSAVGLGKLFFAYPQCPRLEHQYEPQWPRASLDKKGSDKLFFPRTSMRTSMNRR